MNVGSIHVAAAIVIGLHPSEREQQVFQNASMVVRNTGGCPLLLLLSDDVGYPWSDVAKYQSLNDEFTQLHNEYARLLQQESENEMVMIELNTQPTKPSCLFGLLGQVIFPQDILLDVYEAKLVVQRRLDCIRKERKWLQKKIMRTEHRGQELAKKIKESMTRHHRNNHQKE